MEIKELRRGGRIREAFNSKNQRHNTFLMPLDLIKKTWWKLWNSQVLELGRGGPTREASNLKNQPIYILIMPHIQKKVQEIRKFLYF